MQHIFIVQLIWRPTAVNNTIQRHKYIYEDMININIIVVNGQELRAELFVCIKQ